jgi:hypothetical protein
MKPRTCFPVLLGRSWVKMRRSISQKDLKTKNHLLSWRNIIFIIQKLIFSLFSSFRRCIRDASLEHYTKKKITVTIKTDKC